MYIYIYKYKWNNVSDPPLFLWFLFCDGILSLYLGRFDSA